MERRSGGSGPPQLLGMARLCIRVRAARRVQVATGLNSGMWRSDQAS